MPSRSGSRSYSRGRAAKRYRSRSGSRGSGMYAMATASRSRSRSRARKVKRISLNTHCYSRWTEPATKSYVSQGESLDFEFKFEDIINYTEFSNLYDSFKIDYVSVTFQLINNPNAFLTPNNDPSAQNPQTNYYPKLWYIRDYDGGSTDTLTEIKERQGVKFFVLRPNKVYTVKLKPMVAVQTYRTATATGYGPKRMTLDFANGVNVPHYGLHTVFDTLGFNPVDTQPWKMRYEVKYYFTCKDVR